MGRERAGGLGGTVGPLGAIRGPEESSVGLIGAQAIEEIVCQ